MKIPLERYKMPAWGSEKITACSSAEPFLMNSRAILIHRPKNVAIFDNANRPSHVAITNLCGATFTGDRKFTFLAEPPEGRIVCAACEGRAVMMGLPTSSEIAGRHVCIGKLKAVKVCCTD